MLSIASTMIMPFLSFPVKTLWGRASLLLSSCPRMWTLHRGVERLPFRSNVCILKNSICCMSKKANATLISAIVRVDLRKRAPRSWAFPMTGGSDYGIEAIKNAITFRAFAMKHGKPALGMAFSPSVVVRRNGNDHHSRLIRSSPQTCPVKRRSFRDTPSRRPRHAYTMSTSSTQSRVLWAETISKTYDGETQILPTTSLTVPRGAKVAILGPNGSGKSTLLSILAGLSTPDAGHVVRSKGLTVAHVAQELPESVSLELPAFRTVLSLAAQHSPTPAVRAALRYSEAAEAAENGDEARLKRLADAVAAMDGVPGAWEVDSFLETVMTRLEIPRARKIGDLSGGQKRRVSIAAALVARPDVLLLDEVTNHLSVEGIEFLEDVLQDPSLTVVAISHDRYFVEKVCTTAIWELDGELRTFPPGYEEFLQEKATSLEQETKEVADLAKAFRKEAEWMRRQPKARATKAKYREEEARRMERELNERREKLNRVKVKSMGKLGSRLGGEVVRVENVCLKRGERVVLDDFSYTFERGERVGICGGNGVGKSSFLKALMGQIPLDSGSIHVGETVIFGHYDQEGIDYSSSLSEASRAVLMGKNADEQRVIEYVTELVSLYGVGQERKGSAVSDVEARLDSQIEALSHSVAVTRPKSNKEVHPLAKMTPFAILDRFGFARDKQHNFISKLSGGEKRRLQLMTLLLRNPNFLLLDEVSNDLDLNTLTMLEELLLQYSGVLLLCSHDRFMLDRLVDHLLVFDGEGGAEMVEGKMTDFLEVRKEAVKEEKKERKDDRRKVEATRSKETKRKLSYKEKREYEGLEADIESMQERHEEVSKLLEEQAESAGYTRLAEWSEELAKTEEEIDRMTTRWVELAEIADG